MTYLFILLLTDIQFSTILTTLVSIFIAILTYVIAPYVTEHAKKIFGKKEDTTKDAVLLELEACKIVYDKLDSIKNSVNCDKIWIEQFHNGSNYLYNAKSMQKFSMKFESADVGIVKTQEMYQNIPIHLYYRYISEIVKNTFLFIDFQNADSPKYDMDALINIYPIKTMYSFPIYSIDDKLLGILGIEFITHHKELERQQLEYILGDVGAIGGILVNYLLKNK